MKLFGKKLENKVHGITKIRGKKMNYDLMNRGLKGTAAFYIAATIASAAIAQPVNRLEETGRFQREYVIKNIHPAGPGMEPPEDLSGSVIPINTATWIKEEDGAAVAVDHRRMNTFQARIPEIRR